MGWRLTGPIKKRKAEKIETDELTKQVDWFHEIIELQDESYDASEFMQGVKEDIFSDKVYVFTPSGDVTELPKGSGPLDFAYSIHTEIGNKTTGAKRQRQNGTVRLCPKKWGYY